MRTKHSQSVSQCMQASHNNNNTNKKYYIKSYTYIAYCFTFGVSEFLYIFSNRFDWASSKNNNNNHIRIQNYDSHTHRVLLWGKTNTHTPDSHPLRRFNTRRNDALQSRFASPSSSTKNQLIFGQWRRRIEIVSNFPLSFLCLIGTKFVYFPIIYLNNYVFFIYKTKKRFPIHRISRIVGKYFRKQKCMFQKQYNWKRYY